MHASTASRPRLTIGYSCLGERAGDIRLPDPHPDTEILVVVQGDPALAPRRDDVRVLALDSLGVARSRNAVLDHAAGEIVLFGDDDIVWFRDGIDAVLAAFDEDPSLALVLAQAVDESGALRKRYREARHRLTRWNAAKAATYEMFVRVDAFRAAEVRFDEQFGAGAEDYLGDEYILIADAVRQRLVCHFVPVVVAVHPEDSSGARFGTHEDAHARANVFARVFGPMAGLVRLGFVLRQPTRFASVGLAARFVAGAFPPHYRTMLTEGAEPLGGGGDAGQPTATEPHGRHEASTSST